MAGCLGEWVDKWFVGDRLNERECVGIVKNIK